MPTPDRSLGARGIVSWVLYQAVFFVAMLFYGPVLLWRMVFQPSHRRGLKERFGHVRPTQGDRPVLWLHGVSVGEIKAAGTLLRLLQERYPHMEIVVSATTPTGHLVARQDNPKLRVIYYPLDFGWFPGRALNRIRPQCVLLMELEIWPNFLTAARRRGIAVGVVNGRISEPTYRGYRRVRWLLPQLDWIAEFCVQDRVYLERLRDLRLEPHSIHVTGNVKYDSVLLEQPAEEVARLRPWLTDGGRQLVVVAGSTHHDEELQLARILDALGAAGTRVRLVLVPRHPERGPVVVDGLVVAGISVRRWSEVGAPAGTPFAADLAPEEVLLVDAVGLLQRFYAACDVAFVGGSLIPHGGQNMLEPAALGKPVLFGPHTTNFRTDVGQLLGARAAVQVADVAALKDELSRMLSDGRARRELGARAVALVHENQGASERTLGHLESLLPERPISG